MLIVILIYIYILEDEAWTYVSRCRATITQIIFIPMNP